MCKRDEVCVIGGEENGGVSGDGDDSDQGTR